MPTPVKDYTFTLSEKAIDDVRPVKVICVGAGFSGVCTAIRFPQRIKNLDLTIYEKASVITRAQQPTYPG